MFPKSLFLTQLVIAGRAIHYFKQADFFKEVDRVNNCPHFTSGSYFLHSFLLYSKNYPKVLVPGGVVAYYSVHFPTVLDEQVDK